MPPANEGFGWSGEGLCVLMSAPSTRSTSGPLSKASSKWMGIEPTWDPSSGPTEGLKIGDS
jgi:hypothetical protein